jgi:hypothetical protein
VQFLPLLRVLAVSILALSPSHNFRYIRVYYSVDVITVRYAKFLNDAHTHFYCLRDSTEGYQS